MHVVTQLELDVHASNTRTPDIFGRCFYFDAFSTVHTKRIYRIYSINRPGRLLNFGP